MRGEFGEILLYSNSAISLKFAICLFCFQHNKEKGIKEKNIENHLKNVL